MAADEHTSMVEAGYDRLAERFSAWTARIEGDPKLDYAERFASRLSAGARVLDLGCGAGVPCTLFLAERFQVTGVDVSEAQLGLARRSIPQAEFVRGDMTRLGFPEKSFDGITAFYALMHLPSQQQPSMLKRIGRWLKPGGVFLASFGIGDNADWTGEWLGVPMFFSSFDAATYHRLIAEARLDVIVDDVVTIREPEGEATFLWIMAQKPE